MIRTSLRRAIAPGIAALTVVALSACGAGNDAGGSDGGDGISGTIDGGGASSQEKAQNAWRAGFQTANSGATINYDPIGSGDGRKNFISEAFAFAGTDSALSDDEGELTAANERCGADVIQVPAYISPIAVVYKLDGVDELNLSAEVLSNIFLGKITKWNDPAIVALNDGASLPDADISTVHRGDDSGTTDNFTKYLEAAGGGAWTEEPDGVWPEGLPGTSGTGTSGMIDAVTGGENTIGYADESAAADAEVGIAKIQVGEEFVEPTAEGAAKVVEISPPVEGASASNLAVDLARDTTEAGTYPVILVSYLLACPTYPDAETADVVKGYLEYVVSPEGQKAASDEAGSAELSSSLQEKAAALVEGIKAG